MERVWPADGLRSLEENTLDGSHIPVRKALGSDRANPEDVTSGRGLSLVGNWTIRVKRTRARPGCVSIPTAKTTSKRLRPIVTRNNVLQIIGRIDCWAQIAGILSAYRM